MRYLNNKYIFFESNINDIIRLCRKYNIEKYIINDDMTVDVNGDVFINNINNRKTNRIPIIFNNVYGDFSINSIDITDLYGCPKVVGGNFKIISTKIKGLKYSPVEINRSMYIRFNNKLKSLKYFPKYVGLDVDFYSCDLNTLVGCIDSINGNFCVELNVNLKSLVGGPKIIEGSYFCSYCNISSLYGAPKYIGGDFMFKDNNISSFQNFPYHVGGDINCENNPVHEIWKLFKDKDQIEYFNQMKIINGDTINIKKLNLFLKYIGKEPVENVKGYVNI